MTVLTLVRLRPDMGALSAWATREVVPIGQGDVGYAVHAAMRASLGALAPQPWVLRSRRDEVELVGYSGASPADLQVALALPPSNPAAASALGLRCADVVAMPEQWQVGAVLSFETRVRPVVRQSRTANELDVAVVRHAKDANIGREQAYRDWLADEFARRTGASVLQSRLVSYQRVQALRRTHGADRRVCTVEGPAAVLRGELAVTDSTAFAAMLSRGLGRHRAFGYGCVLLAPRGVLA